MEFNLDNECDRPLPKTLTLKSTEGFHLSFEQKEGEDGLRLYQHLYGERVYLMSIGRERIADIIYALEDFL